MCLYFYLYGADARTVRPYIAGLTILHGKMAEVADRLDAPSKTRWELRRFDGSVIGYEFRRN